MAKNYKTLFLYKPFSECEPGTRIVTQQKIVTNADISTFCAMTKQDLGMFLHDETARLSGWPRPLVPGVYTLACSVGLMESSGILSDVIAYMGVDEVRFSNPVFPGDIIHVESELLSKRLTKSGDRGLINYKWETYNQDGTLVASGTNTCMYRVRKEGQEAAFTSIQAMMEKKK